MGLCWDSCCGSSFCPMLTNSRDPYQRQTSSCLKSLLAPPEVTVPDLTHCTGFSFTSKGWHQLGVRGYSVENHGVFFHISSLPIPVDNSKRNTMMALFLAHPTALSPGKITVITVQFWC